MSIDVIPSGVKASSIALITAAGAPVVPPSPAPFTPNELVGLGISFKVLSLRLEQLNKVSEFLF